MALKQDLHLAGKGNLTLSRHALAVFGGVCQVLSIC